MHPVSPVDTDHWNVALPPIDGDMHHHLSDHYLNVLHDILDPHSYDNSHLYVLERGVVLLHDAESQIEDNDQHVVVHNHLPDDVLDDVRDEEGPSVRNDEAARDEAARDGAARDARARDHSFVPARGGVHLQLCNDL